MPGATRRGVMGGDGPRVDLAGAWCDHAPSEPLFVRGRRKRFARRQAKSTTARDGRCAHRPQPHGFAWPSVARDTGLSCLAVRPLPARIACLRRTSRPTPGQGLGGGRPPMRVVGDRGPSRRAPAAPRPTVDCRCSRMCCLVSEKSTTTPPRPATPRRARTRRRAR